ncbi:DUF3078 domain-containing protein [Alistipes sp. An116]|uniref:DUF3078 domain-containing protein n=1 Tax=Alistipes sp. An116 TaxID=1965546 RepID=UPI000B393396|nr:DUF3078 domain-containing protein [Alistipes sp. An116]OUQ53139.1 DUF3078 domain-containing protein [Alistipes sp. An116]
MKRSHVLLAGLFLLFSSLPAAAQISIDEVNAEPSDVKFHDELKSTSVDVDYFSLARYKAERAAIRKERNDLEISAGLQGTLTSYNDPWISVSGGDNSIALVASFNLRHLFKKNLFSIETKASAKLGYNRMKVETTNAENEPVSNGVWFKNQDEFVVWVNPAFKLAKNWSYGSTFQFRSQFVNGYKSRTEQEREHLKSSFLSPGYLDISLGLTYKSPLAKFPIAVNISPVALSAVFVESSRIRSNSWDSNKLGWESYGLASEGKTSKYEGGSSVEINFDRTFGKTGYLRYRTTLYTFYGWITDVGQPYKYNDYNRYLDAVQTWEQNGSDPELKPRLAIHPTVRWTNTVDIKATKFLTTTLSFQLYYNRAQNLSVQTETLLSVGLTYTFKNK